MSDWRGGFVLGLIVGGLFGWFVSPEVQRRVRWQLKRLVDEDRTKDARELARERMKNLVRKAS